MITRRRAYAAVLAAAVLTSGASSAFADYSDTDTKKVCVALGSDPEGKAPICVWVPVGDPNQ